MDSRRSSIAKDPGRVFDDILGTSKDLKITSSEWGSCLCVLFGEWEILNLQVLRQCDDHSLD